MPTRHPTINSPKKRLLARTVSLQMAFLAAAILAGCGGGGGGGGGSAGFPVAMTAATAATPEAAAPAAVTAPAAKAPADCSLELYGDSISVGALVLETPVAARIAILRPAWIVHDHSLPGMSASVQSQIFPNGNRTGRVVAFALGTNDLSLDASPAPALRAMSEYAKAEGRKVIFTGIPAMDHTRRAEFNDDERALATEIGATWAGWETVAHDTRDGVHPTQAMSDALTDKLIGAVEATLPECKP